MTSGCASVPASLLTATAECAAAALRCSWLLRSFPVGSQELGQRCQQGLGSLLGDPVACAWKHDALHVVGDEFHRRGDPFATAFLTSNCEDGMISRRVFRCSFCAIMAGNAR